MRLALAAAALLLFALPTSAQTPCTDADPCLIAIDADETTLTVMDGASYTVTAGDWFSFDVFNFDDVEHSISIADLDILMEAPSLDSAVYGPYEMDAPGSYVIEDLTTGATATLVVVEEDVAAQAQDDEDAPGLSVAILAVGLLGLLLVRRN